MMYLAAVAIPESAGSLVYRWKVLGYHDSKRKARQEIAPYLERYPAAAFSIIQEKFHGKNPFYDRLALEAEKASEVSNGKETPKG